MISHSVNGKFRALETEDGSFYVTDENGIYPCIADRDGKPHCMCEPALQGKSCPHEELVALIQMAPPNVKSVELPVSKKLVLNCGTHKWIKEGEDLRLEKI
jgi:hypothetical protein